jgi:hypothetical protein
VAMSLGVSWIFVAWTGREGMAPFQGDMTCFLLKLTLVGRNWLMDFFNPSVTSRYEVGARTKMECPVHMFAVIMAS